MTVNGYSCKNCKEVNEARTHIDPVHPKDGPYGVNGRSKTAGSHGAAIILGGQPAALSPNLTSPPVTPKPAFLDISA